MNKQKLCLSDLRVANEARLQSTPKFRKCIGWSRAQWLQAMLVELGELANEMKKSDRGDYNQHEAKEKFKKEIADVQIYLDLLATKLGINLAEATICKFNEVSIRVDSQITIGHDGLVYYAKED